MAGLKPCAADESLPVVSGFSRTTDEQEICHVTLLVGRRTAGDRGRGKRHRRRSSRNRVRELRRAARGAPADHRAPRRGGRHGGSAGRRARHDARASRRGRASAPRGATTLRPVRRAPGWAWAAGAAAAAALVFFFVVVPGVDRRTTVSAAEILGRSRTALGADVTGIEVLTYDLALEGVLGDLIPARSRRAVHRRGNHRPRSRRALPHRQAGRQRPGRRGGRRRFAAADAGAVSAGRRQRVSLQVHGRRAHGVVGAGVETRAAPDPDHAHADEQRSDAARAAAQRRGLLPGRDPREPRAGGTAVRAGAGARGGDGRGRRGWSSSPRQAASRIAPSPSTSRCGRGRCVPRPARRDSDFDIAPQPGDVVFEGNVTIASSNPMWDIVSRSLGAIPPAAGPAAQPLMTHRRDSRRVADEILRRRRRGRGPGSRRHARRGLRVPRPERRRQDHDDQDAARSRAPDARPHPGRRPRLPRRRAWPSARASATCPPRCRSTAS